MTLEILIISTIIILGLTLLFNKIKNNIKLYSEIKSIFYILIIILIIRSFILEPFKIPTGSMKPTILDGDYIFVNKFIYGIKTPIYKNKIINISKPSRGDIAVFKHKNGDAYIKRIVGLPGDKIEYKNKKIYINNLQIKNKYIGQSPKNINKYCFEEIIDKNKKHDIYINKKNQEEYNYNNIIIPESSYFVLGDNRDNSDDSRFWGFVDEKDLIGKGMIIWMSIDVNEKDIRWNRIFKKLN